MKTKSNWERVENSSSLKIGDRVRYWNKKVVFGKDIKDKRIVRSIHANGSASSQHAKNIFDWANVEVLRKNPKVIEFFIVYMNDECYFNANIDKPFNIAIKSRLYKHKRSLVRAAKRLCEVFGCTYKELK